MPREILLCLLLGVIFVIFCLIAYLGDMKNLNIPSKQVGNGQHGTARFATRKEMYKTFAYVPYKPSLWRKQNPKDLPQGIIVGCNIRGKTATAIVDEGDVHALMIGAAGVGKTAKFLFPNLEYACASGMSFITTDTKGDLVRAYGAIARDYYGYDISVLDLRNPTQSDGFNMLYLVNRYMDEYLLTDSLPAKAKAEKYAKITAKTIIYSGDFDSSNAGQNAFFYDSAEGILTATILVLAEFCSPVLKQQEEAEKQEELSQESESINLDEQEAVPEEGAVKVVDVDTGEVSILRKKVAAIENDAEEVDCRHIISVFKLTQDLLAPGKVKGKTQFKELMDRLPDEHKARWFSGSALNTSEQSMQSVLATALSRLNAFLDSELEQVLCFDTKIDAERFCNQKSAIFLVLPEEDNSKYFLVSLIIQQLYREMLTVADEHGGKLPNRVMMYLDEYGTLPKIESAEMMFSASRSRRISIIAIIQSLAQLEKNYGKEGAEIIIDNCQLSIYGGFAPNSETANVVSKNLGEQTVQSGSVSRGKDKSQSLQMIGRPLMTTDELKSMPKDTFLITKTGAHPMRTILRLFFLWGIELDKEFAMPPPKVRKVHYVNKTDVEKEIIKNTKRTEDEKEEERKRVHPFAIKGQRLKT